MPEINFYSTEGNKLIQGWVREFDELCKKQNGFSNVPRYVTVDGKNMTIDDFLNYKVKLFNQ